MKDDDGKKKSTFIIDSIVTCLTILTFIISYFVIFKYKDFISFAETNLADDGVINNQAMAVVRLYSALLYGFILLFFIKYFKPKMVSVNSSMVRFAYLISFLLVVIHFFWADIWYLYEEDCLMESLTVVMAGTTSGFFLILGIDRKDRSAKIFMYLVSGLMLFFALEEMSWGQRVFGWDSPDIFLEINQQEEINIHNIFNFAIPFVYVITLLLIANIFFFREEIVAVLKKKHLTEDLADIIPSSDYYYFGYVFLFLTGYSTIRGGEITEEVFAFVMLVYSIDLLKKCRRKKSFSK